MLRCRNIAKTTEFASEDFVKVGEEGEYVITVIGDGNGTVGRNSRKYIIGGKKYSEISLTTEQLVTQVYTYIAQRIKLRYTRPSVEEYHPYSETPPLSLTKTRLKIMFKDAIITSVSQISGEIYSCLILGIIDRKRNRLYCVSVGDCEFLIVDLMHRSIFMRKPPQTTTSLHKNFNGFYISVPNSVSKNIIGIIESYVTDLPITYCILMYSDGLGREAYIQDRILYDSLPYNTIPIYDFLNYASGLLVEKFNQLQNNKKYIKAVIEEKDLLDIILNYYEKGSDSIINHLIEQTNESYKNDDRSISVFIN